MSPRAWFATALLATIALAAGLTFAPPAHAQEELTNDIAESSAGTEGCDSAGGADCGDVPRSCGGLFAERLWAPGCFCDSLPDRVFPENDFDLLYDRLQTWKSEHHLPITIGAWHWWHANNGGPSPSGYGIPGTLNGTYYYYLTADPEIERSFGPFTKLGAHVEYRLRDGGDGFRTFFSTAFWFYELYAWADTDFGRLKAGKIWKRFGLDWDGTFWGNVPYFDGFKLDPDWGVALENTPQFDNGFKIDAFAQFFFHEDGVNGSLAGADPESVVGSNERNTGVVRVVPTWELGDQSTLACGMSALVGRVQNAPFVGDNQTTSAWAADATYTKANFKVFAEVMQSFGAIHPTRYVSGGPANRTTNALVGAHYTCGPVTYRVSYSAGFDDNPGGRQDLWVPGATIALTKNLDFYLEYVRWDVRGNSAADFLEFEDGLQIVVHWQF